MHAKSVTLGVLELDDLLAEIETVFKDEDREHKHSNFKPSDKLTM